MSLIEKTGPAQPTPSFEEQMRQAESDSGMPPDEELYAGYGVDHPEPNEHGQIPTNRTVEAEAEETPEAPEVTEPVAEKEETVEAVPEVPELPDRVEELNKKVGQLVNENAELRKFLEQQAQPQQPQQQFQAPLTQETVNYLDELSVENPQQAVYVALQSGQPVLYERAMQSWYDQDPRAAGRYERQVEYQQLQQQLGAQIQPQLATANQMAEAQQLEAAMKAVADKHEDFGDVIGTLDQERAQQIVDGGLPPSILKDLAGGDQQSKEKVFEAIYRWVKADLGDTFKTAAEEASIKQAEENKQAKVDATVASATTTTPDAVPETEEERLRRVWIDQYPTMQSAWTGRSAR